MTLLLSPRGQWLSVCGLKKIAFALVKTDLLGRAQAVNSPKRSDTAGALPFGVWAMTLLRDTAVQHVDSSLILANALDQCATELHSLHIQFKVLLATSRSTVHNLSNPWDPKLGPLVKARRPSSCLRLSRRKLCEIICSCPELFRRRSSPCEIKTGASWAEACCRAATCAVPALSLGLSLPKQKHYLSLSLPLSLLLTDTLHLMSGPSFDTAMRR